MTKIWPGCFVEEDNLKVTISMLRKALDDGANGARFIETVPKRGYRFIGAVQAATSAAPVADPPALPPPPKRSRLALAIGCAALVLAVVTLASFSTTARQSVDSLAVAPFVNTGGDPKMEFLSDGITEMLIDDLSQALHLKVIASSSAFRYKGKDADPRTIGRELQADAVLAGRITQHGDQVVISAELVDARDNRHLWGSRYERPIADIVNGPHAIALDITAKLRLQLTIDGQPTRTAAHTDNLEALEYYMEGRSYLHRRTREDLQRAILLYRKAIEADPNYARAYAGLAESYGNLGVRGHIAPAEGRRLLTEAAHKAIALDDNLAESHVALGYSYMGFAPYKFADADRELRTALELSPSLAIAHMYLSLSLFRQGRLAEALPEILKARELDPLSAISARQVALYYQLSRDYPRALAVLRDADALGPPFSATNEIEIYIHNQAYDEALAGLRRAMQDRRDDPILVYSAGMIDAVQGRRARALSAVGELERLSLGDSQAHWIAKIYAALNDKALALSWLERGFDAGALGAFYKDEPVWDAVRGEPRFSALLERAGLSRRSSPAS